MTDEKRYELACLADRIRFATYALSSRAEDLLRFVRARDAASNALIDDALNALYAGDLISAIQAFREAKP